MESRGMRRINDGSTREMYPEFHMKFNTKLFSLFKVTLEN